MKKSLRICALSLTAFLMALPLSGKGLKELNIFNHLGVGIHAATTGFGIEAATPITDFISLRAGATFMPGFSFSTNVNGNYNADINGVPTSESFEMSIDGGLKRTQGSVILNIYPFARKSSFYVAAGAYFGGSTVISLSGHSDELAELAANNSYIEIGDYEIPVDENGNAEGALKVNSFRPYLGLGFGRPIPSGRLNLGIELGVQFMGHIKVYSNGQELDKTVIDNDDDWKKWMDKLTVYPVLKITLSGRIF